MTAILKSIDALILRLNYFALSLGAVCLLLIMVIGTTDVIFVNTFDTPVPAALEASEVLLGVAVFMTFAYAQNMRQHIHVDLVYNRSPQTVRWIVTLITLLFGTALFLVFGLRAWELAMRSLRVGETANAVFAFPIWPAKMLVATGAYVAMLEFLRQLVWHFIDPHRVDDSGSTANQQEAN